jgi:carbamoyltransferase
MSKYILGISAYYHDSAATLLCDGEIIAAAQEERFSRKKHDERFPHAAVRYCLTEGGITLSDVEAIVFYDKPLLKFERLLETYLAIAPKGFTSFLRAIPVWLKEKLFLRRELRKELEHILREMSGTKKIPPLFFSGHHQSHAASAFFPSPYKKAAVLCVDGVGEWATTTAWLGEGHRLNPLWEIRFPHSLGLLYSAFTYYTGFKVNSGEYKLMGLAPYGEPTYVDLIKKHLIDLRDDGTFRMDMSYFDYMGGLTMTSEKFNTLFGGPARKPESPLTQREMDIARSIQEVTEEIVLRLAKTIQKETQARYLCLAGGVALNCVANGRLLREKIFDDIWIQPAAGDAGGSLGAALAYWYEHLGNERKIVQGKDSMKGSYLGPEWGSDTIREFLDRENIPYLHVPQEALYHEITRDLEEGKVIGWFQGRMEFGPRALGNRSIIGDARNTKMQSVMNLKIKYRESFRPFAPAVLAEDVSEYFLQDRPSPYMLIVAEVVSEKRIPMTAAEQKLFGIEKLNIPRSTIPAVTHVDYSARIQTIHKDTNPRFHSLLSVFKQKTGSSVLVNTSFNVRGEPIVCSPEEAYACFRRTEMDTLVLGDYVIRKHTRLPEWKESDEWKTAFTLD